MGAKIEMTASDGHRLSGYLASPAARPRGGLVVIQTAFGLDDYLRGVCDAYARDGFLALAPALYDRQQRDAVFEHTPEGGAAAGAMRKGFVWADVLRDVEAARLAVATAGTTGVLGFCVGGSVAWLAANALPFAVAVSYYGKDIVDCLDRAPRCPIMLHFGEQDRLISADDVATIRAAFPTLPIYAYKAGHGFDANNPDAAKTARARTLAFLGARMT